MKGFVFPLILLILLQSCYHENIPERKKPDRFLTEDSLVLVLADIQLAESAIEYRRENNIYKTNDPKRFYAYIYKKYNLTPETLKENLDYYNSDPDKMVGIYDKVMAVLTKQQVDIEIQKKLMEQHIKDSLAKIDTTHYVYKNLKPVLKEMTDVKKVWPTPW